MKKIITLLLAVILCFFITPINAQENNFNPDTGVVKYQKFKKVNQLR